MSITQTASGDSFIGKTTSGIALTQNISGNNNSFISSDANYGIIATISDTTNLNDGGAGHFSYGLFLSTLYTGINTNSAILKHWGASFSSGGNMGTVGNTAHYGVSANAASTADNNYAFYASAAGAINNYCFFADSGDMNLSAGNFLTTGTWGSGTGTITTNAQTPLSLLGTNVSFYQENIQNSSSANGASSDYVATADTGTISTKYIDMGINGSGGGIAPFTTALEGYLYTSDDNLNIGAINAAKTVKLFAGDSTTARMTIASTGVTLSTPLAVGSGGTGATIFNARGVVLGGTTSTGALQSIANSATAGVFLRNIGSSSNPAWSTLVLPNSATQNYIPYATTLNTWGESVNLQYDGTTFYVTGTGAQMENTYTGSIMTTYTTDSTGTLTIQTSGGATGDILLVPTGAAAATSILFPTGIVIFGGYGLTNNERLQWDFETTANKVAVTSASGVNDLNFTGMSLSILSDTLGLILGAGSDMSVYYDGTYGQINTSLIAASDLRVTCGTNKTLELQNVVYEDLQFPVSSAKVPAVNAPTWETFTTNTNEYSFTVNDFIDANAGEVPHKWVEGTAASPHLHVTPKDAQSTGSNRFAKFTIYVAYSDSTQAGTKVWTETTSTAELTIPTGTAALTGFYLDLPDISLTGYKVGTQIKVRIKRIAATGGTEYGSNVFITQCGIHFQENTIGSRQETVK